MLADAPVMQELPAIKAVDRGWSFNEMASGRVLVAEDDKSVRDSLVRALTFEGYDVTTAADGAEALMAVLETQPDVILLDVLMPHVDGLTACRKLRERGDRTPVLMLTARHEVSDRVAGLDAGADDYLVKPFALDELLARLRALLRRTSMSGDDEVLRVGDLSLDPGAPSGVAGRSRARAHQDRVRPARAPPLQRRHRAHARTDLRAHLGLRLRDVVEVARRVHQLPATQDRGSGRVPPHPHGAGSRVHGPTVVSRP